MHSSDLKRAFALLFVPALVVLAAGACKSEDPLYCDSSTPCTDPDRPFCDLTGAYPASGGIGKTCIADPAAAADAGAKDPDAGPEPVTIAQVAVGGATTCVVLSTGQLRCWGQRDFMGLGDLGATGQPTDSVIPTGGAVAQVAVGSHHLCLRYKAGSVRCVGENLDGELGYGHKNDLVQTPDQVADLDLGQAATSIGAGRSHSCAALESGALKCWGKNIGGHLGQGNTDDLALVKPVNLDAVSLGDDLQSLAVGEVHTCAVVTGGSVHCWGGSNANGQLGYGTGEPQGDDETPAQAGYVNVGAAVAQVVQGANYACARTTGGQVRCWGFPLFLGVPDNDENIGDTEDPATLDYTDIGGTAVQLAGGDQSPCALLDSKEVVCWGNGYNGALGYGDTDDVGVDQDPAEAGTLVLGGSVAALADGATERDHHCAIMTTGSLRCWGQNDLGQLGYGHDENVGDDETPASEGDVRFMP